MSRTGGRTLAAQATALAEQQRREGNAALKAALLPYRAELVHWGAHDAAGCPRCAAAEATWNRIVLGVTDD